VSEGPKKTPWVAKTKQTEAYVEYLKHLTTLSTGSIVLIAAFLEKLFSKPVWKLTVAVSLIGFMVSVVSSVISYTIFIEFHIEADEPSPRWSDVIVLAAMLLTWVGFLVGILSLAIFALKNLMQ
jgi:hypothetical protein